MTVVPRGEKTHHKSRPISVKYVIAFFIFIGFAACVAILAYGFLYGHWYKGAMRTFAKLPIPAAQVDGQKIWYKDVVELAAIAEIQDEDVPFDSALETLIDRAYMRSLAADLNTGVAQEKLDSYPLDQEELASLLESAKWTIDDYRNYVIEPLLLYQAVDEEIKDSSKHQTIALAKLESIIENIELGVSFVDLAVQYSEHPSYAIGGDLGFLEIDDLESDKTFGMGDKTLTWNIAAPSSIAMEWNVTGAYSGDALHIHQHQGNPGEARLVVIEAEDADILPLQVEGVASQTVFIIGTTTIENGNLLVDTGTTTITSGGLVLNSLIFPTATGSTGYFLELQSDGSLAWDNDAENI